MYLFSDGLPNRGPGLADADRARVDTLEASADPADQARGAAARETLLADALRAEIRTTWNARPAGRRVAISAVGFFYESPQVGAFLWGMSRENGGSFVGMSKPQEPAGRPARTRGG